MKKMKKEAVREIKEGTKISNSKTGAVAIVTENFGGGLQIEVTVNGKIMGKGNMSYAQMHDMINNEYTTIEEVK